MTISDKLKALGADKVHARLGDTISLREKSLWEGPNGGGPNGGITYSTLSRFLVCRERFRLYMMEGLRSEDKFNHKKEYGNMWHICEEAYSKCQENTCYEKWYVMLARYARKLCEKYSYDQTAIDHWYNVCKSQFPIYFYYWSNKREEAKITPLLQEQVFDVSYSLPSGREVRLRGKWDSVDLVEEKCNKCNGKGGFLPYEPGLYNETCIDCKGTGRGKVGIWLQENKTKGDIREGQIKRQLHFDLQTMLYLVALTRLQEEQDIGRHAEVEWCDANLISPIAGVRYNVVKRPLSGGKGTIVRKKGTKKVAPETKEHYYGRVSEVIKSDPQSYFMRWNVGIAKEDILRFRGECLDPILENLVSWYAEITGNMDERDSKPPLHWRHPYGVWNVLDNGGSSDYDDYLATGSLVGLRMVDKLFEELD